MFLGNKALSARKADNLTLVHFSKRQERLELRLRMNGKPQGGLQRQYLPLISSTKLLKIAEHSIFLR
jgi:hypothetical protein